MNFLTRFIIVIVWLIGISASAFAVTRSCTKKEKTNVRHVVKTSQHTNPASSSTSDKSAASCTGNVSLYCIRNEETVFLYSYSNHLISTGFIIHPTLSGFKNKPYSPPRQLFNL